MFESNQDIQTPSDDTVVWRYLDLERLLALLCTKKLHLCRLDLLRDPWEGAWPKFLQIESGDNPKFAPMPWTEEYWEHYKLTFFVNCWHSSEHESAALWEIYGLKAGLALRSNIGRLKRGITSNEQFFIGTVKYVDYSTYALPTNNLLLPAFLKRKSFDHEKEIRVPPV